MGILYSDFKWSILSEWVGEIVILMQGIKIIAKVRAKKKPNKSQIFTGTPKRSILELP